MPKHRHIRAFTLAEILITTILLTTLAAITIPRHPDDRDVRSCGGPCSQLQTLRSQIELFKIQHNDTPPDLSSGWAIMLGKSNPNETGPSPGSTTGTLGPYMQVAPFNAVNNQSAVGALYSPTIGWVYVVTGNDYHLFAVNTTGTALLKY